ncbi:imelysin family protein [Adhaeribacter soli]|uniref:Imelysin family protein n=1 Tax=Adhaeribacter soli TaxID=2607655 RepID=A0A5N1IR50_9BACT|nr:imelysin family protein [Adhaeribacter soli]KAA9327426.1 imelysin family protein [Adhaeribacter soli]
MKYLLSATHFKYLTMKLSGRKLMTAWLTAITLLVTACKENNNSQVVPETGFDKTAMLTNYADSLIIPAYSGMQQQLQVLEPAVNAFLANPTAANQQVLKPVFKDAYLQFQRIAVYQLGPAETVMLNNFLNMFPANTATIENNISRGSYDLTGNLSVDQQGFPALDYLLFSPDAVQQLNDPNSANRKKYVQDLMTRMKSLTGTVLTEWNNSYRAQFIGNTKADVGSPLGFMINRFAFEMDQLKGPRIGWPFGKQSGGIVFADKCEAYYSGISRDLAVENLSSLKKAYMGGNGSGIDDYLVALKKEQLNTDVLNQFDLTINKLKAIPDPLSASFTNNPAQVDAAYREIQTLLTLLKTDVASATGVRITYQDSDGD